MGGPPFSPQHKKQKDVLKEGFVIYLEEDKLRTKEKDVLKKSRFSSSANNELTDKALGPEDSHDTCLLVK